MGSLHCEHPWGGSGDWAGVWFQNHYQVDSRDEHACPRDHIQEPWSRRVSFRTPEDEESVTENQEPSIKLPIKDLESWLDDQADELGTPLGGEN